MMLTILHDSDFASGRKVEVASADGAMITAPSRATCKLAAALIENGYPADLPVRVVRANPWLFGPPHHVSGVSLRTVADFDFFADEEGPRDAAADIPLPRSSDSAVR
jgi:hypothetical protein